jgi:hypothetical protein
MLPCLAEWLRQCKHKPISTFVQPLMIPTMFLSFFLFLLPPDLYSFPFLHILLNSSYDVASRRFYSHYLSRIPASLTFIVFHDVMACTTGSLILTRKIPP